jgi:GntR family transcriptional repressor for pyruvate dehydrogenase complex
MASSAASFARVRIPKGSELLAQRVRAAILVGDVPVGSQLPPEHELVRQFGVSRATVREGFRLLEADGLIETRPGRRGGATVCRPGAGTHTRSLALLLQFDGATLGALLEARRVLKPICGRLAAERMQPDELVEMRTALAEMRRDLVDPEAYHRASIRFHLLIAQGTRNPVLGIYATSLAELIYDQICQVPFTSEDLAAGLASCERILEALEARDGEAAERRLARHLAGVEQAVERRGWSNHRSVGLPDLADGRDGSRFALEVGASSP